MEVGIEQFAAFASLYSIPFYFMMVCRLEKNIMLSLREEKGWMWAK
jgi:hypothetical protein